MESCLVLMLCLPPHYGGYGLPIPDMNPATFLNDLGKMAFSEGQLHCDLHWREAHVACEYDSRMHHEGRLSEDAIRLNTLNDQGERVFVVSPEIIRNLSSVHYLAQQLARALGKRLRPEAMEMTPARIKLHKTLFPWAYRNRY